MTMFFFCAACLPCHQQRHGSGETTGSRVYLIPVKSYNATKKTGVRVAAVRNSTKWVKNHFSYDS